MCLPNTEALGPLGNEVSGAEQTSPLAENTASVVQKVRPDVYNDPLQPCEKSFKITSNFLMKETKFRHRRRSSAG